MVILMLIQQLKKQITFFKVAIMYLMKFQTFGAGKYDFNYLNI